jgi:hypothetical protein
LSYASLREGDKTGTVQKVLRLPFDENDEVIKEVTITSKVRVN